MILIVLLLRRGQPDSVLRQTALFTSTGVPHRLTDESQFIFQLTLWLRGPYSFLQAAFE